jgi:hypothetical protein
MTIFLLHLSNSSKFLFVCVHIENTDVSISNWLIRAEKNQSAGEPIGRAHANYGCLKELVKSCALCMRKNEATLHAGRHELPVAGNRGDL